MTSIAPRLAIVPATAPNTGNCRFQAGGSVGYRHARQGPRPAAPSSTAFQFVHRESTSGFACSTAARFSNKRSWKSGATRDQVRILDEPIHIFGVDVFADRDDFDVRIERPQPFGGLLDARLPKTGVAHQELAVEIVGAKVARMSKDKPAHTCCRQLQGERSADAARREISTVAFFKRNCPVSPKPATQSCHS